MNSACRIVCFGRNGCALSWRRAVVVAGGATEGSPAILAGTAAVVDDDALAVLVAVVVTLLVGGDDDAGCSADPCSGDDVGDACSVLLSAKDDFSVPD